MVPVEMRQLPHVSFTQLDQYLRCPLRYRFMYIDRLEPEFLPAALAFGSGIHGAAALLFRGLARGARPESRRRPGLLRERLEPRGGPPAAPFGRRTQGEPARPRHPDARGALRPDRAGHRGGRRRGAVRRAADRPGHRRGPRPGPRRHARPPRARRRGPAGGRRPRDRRAEVHRPPGRGLAPALDIQLRDVDERPCRPGGPPAPLRRAHQDEAAGAPPVLDARATAANRRLFRLVAEVLHAIEAGVFHPNPGWACKDCPFRSRCSAWADTGASEDPRWLLVPATVSQRSGKSCCREIISRGQPPVGG